MPFPFRLGSRRSRNYPFCRLNLHALHFKSLFSSSSSLPNPPSRIQPQPEQELEFPSLVVRLILAHSGDHITLSNRLPTSPWPPHLVDRVLKLLWNDGPRALLFFRALLQLRSFRPAASSFDHAVDLAARLRDRRAVASILSHRDRFAIPPSPRTFAILFERHVGAGKPELAVRTFLSMHHQGCPQDLSSFNTLLDVLCKSRRVEKAASLLKVFRGRFRPDAVTYNIIADGWCRIKRTPKALEVLRQMVDSGIEPTKNTYNILLKGFFRIGQVNEALQFFKQMKKRGRRGGPGDLECRPDVVSYTTMVHGLGLAGLLQKARKVFDEMISEGCLPSVATYNALIQGFATPGR
ncbi:pentatricopeptide repeat-containing protein At1g74900, mitochondrial-like isoform X2 [Zingiber officinale]|uniref:pentatricopeptide repeat-containing protein At1g74900, mitochondrial-like isoform X2 n=1 Tax=Zingiber officinale TaxID=94328 RepID=UPI001C4BAEBD|nr:pentatricopeptide repeat-containing protein At1g74900, mitochondrial-like isoform X2 [Zingiber officinale]